MHKVQSNAHPIHEYIRHGAATVRERCFTRYSIVLLLLEIKIHRPLLRALPSRPD
jgi:hypothetical protein